MAEQFSLYSINQSSLWLNNTYSSLNQFNEPSWIHDPTYSLDDPAFSFLPLSSIQYSFNTGSTPTAAHLGSSIIGTQTGALGYGAQTLNVQAVKTDYPNSTVRLGGPVLSAKTTNSNDPRRLLLGWHTLLKNYVTILGAGCYRVITPGQAFIESASLNVADSGVKWDMNVKYYGGSGPNTLLTQIESKKSSGYHFRELQWYNIVVSIDAGTTNNSLDATIIPSNMTLSWDFDKSEIYSISTDANNLGYPIVFYKKITISFDIDGFIVPWKTYGQINTPINSYHGISALDYYNNLNLNNLKIFLRADPQETNLPASPGTATDATQMTEIVENLTELKSLTGSSRNYAKLHIKDFNVTVNPGEVAKIALKGVFVFPFTIGKF